MTQDEPSGLEHSVRNRGRGDVLRRRRIYITRLYARYATTNTYDGLKEAIRWYFWTLQTAWTYRDGKLTRLSKQQPPHSQQHPYSPGALSRTRTVCEHCPQSGHQPERGIDLGYSSCGLRELTGTISRTPMIVTEKRGKCSR